MFKSEVVFKNGSRILLDYCKNNSIKSLVVGISGGLDSAIIAGFMEKASELGRKENYDLNCIGVLLPCESTENSIVLGHKVCKEFKLHEILFDLSKIYNSFKDFLEFCNIYNTLNIEEIEYNNCLKIAKGNIKARLRMIALYHIAKINKGIVMSTDNYSEYLMGFWTKHGDEGDFGIIQNLWKGVELYELAKYIGVPQEVIDAKPDDGLGVTPNGDEGQLGASYKEIDRIMSYLLCAGFKPNGSIEQINLLPPLENISENETLVKNLVTRCINNSFKRTGAVNLSRHDLGI